MKTRHNTTIRTTTISLFCAAVFSTAPVYAKPTADERAQQNGLIGLGGGVVIGSLVAGPIGGAVAGLVGLLVAEDINNDDKVARAEKALYAAQQTMTRQDNQLLGLKRKYEDLERKQQLQLVSMEREIEKVTQDLESTIQFRTGSYGVETHYYKQLDLIASGLKDNAQLQASLHGYADQRGESDFNHALSEQRLLSVKKYLLSKGVRPTQITTQAFGEHSPVSKGETFEDDFFDRRVTIRLESKAPVMTAAK